MNRVRIHEKAVPGSLWYVNLNHLYLVHGGWQMLSAPSFTHTILTALGQSIRTSISSILI